MRNSVIFKQLQKKNIEGLVEAFSFPWTNPEETRLKWQRYLKEQNAHQRFVSILESKGEYIGYGSLVYASKYPFFRDLNIPEINDIWIASQHRRKGNGKKLICYLENVALEKNYKSIGIGVGLYNDYGYAQRLYFQLGYVPDGKGITYRNLPVVPGESYPVDDELILWLTKSVSCV